LMTDPSDANGKFLVIQGRDLADLKTAAVALALGQIDAQGTRASTCKVPLRSTARPCASI
jgi:hypothetical protein